MQPAPRDRRADPAPNDASQNTPAESFDRFVFDPLTRAEVKPPIDGQLAARRAYLDYLGALPTVEQVKEFVGDGSEETLAKSRERLAAEAEKSKAESSDPKLPPAK